MNLLESAKAVVRTRKGFQSCQPRDNDFWIKKHQESLDILEKSIRQEEERNVVPLKKREA